LVDSPGNPVTQFSLNNILIKKEINIQTIKEKNYLKKDNWSKKN